MKLQPPIRGLVVAFFETTTGPSWPQFFLEDSMEFIHTLYKNGRVERQERIRMPILTESDIDWSWEMMEIEKEMRDLATKDPETYGYVVTLKDTDGDNYPYEWVGSAPEQTWACVWIVEEDGKEVERVHHDEFRTHPKAKVIRKNVRGNKKEPSKQKVKSKPKEKQKARQKTKPEVKTGNNKGTIAQEVKNKPKKSRNEELIREFWEQLRAAGAVKCAEE
jgi:hypothetical protein